MHLCFDIRSVKTKRTGYFLNSVKKNLDVPIYFNYKEGLNKYFDLEFKTSVIYSLIVSDQSIVKKEFKAFPIKK